MRKYAKIENNNTKLCSVGTGGNIHFYQQIGMTEMDVEQGCDGLWYLNGYAPKFEEQNYIEKRKKEYPSIAEQLDMIYWDKINNTSLWQQKISEIKAKYPKE